jgi:diguanylate cyclase (GGDEF)-like protein/PAS domain S-box-containing protein
MVPARARLARLSQRLDRYRYRLVLGGAIVLYLLLQRATGFTLFETFYRWSHDYKRLYLDEIFSLAIVGAGALALASWWSWHARRRAEVDRRASEARFRALVQHATDVVTVIDARGKITYQSPSAARVLGSDPDALIGRDVFTLVHRHDHERMRTRFTQLQTNPGAVFVETIRVRHREGGWRTVEVTGTNLLHETAVRGIVINLRDVTERSATEAALRESEERYRILVEQIPAALYVNPVGAGRNSGYISPYVTTLTGYTPREWHDEQAHGGACLHEADRARVLAAGAHSARTGTPFIEEYRFVRKDGTIVWVRDEALIVSDGPEGSPRWQGFMLDITARVRAEEALRESEGRYRQMFEGNRAIQIVLDPESGAIVDANPAACAFYGHTWATLTALKISDINTLPAEEIAAELAAARTEHRGYFLFRHRAATGAIRDVEVHSSPLVWHGRQLLFSIIHDITERRALEARLHHQATHDALTGRPNRAHLLDNIGRELIRAERTGRPCAVLFLDLDRFKHVNDSLGHAAGDALLVAVAARLTDTLRAGDTLARLGGDEFVALLTDLADETEALHIAARLHAALERPFSIIDHDIVATTSIGLVVATGVADPPEDLLRFADVALYRAKLAGRSGTAAYAPAMGSGALGRLELEHDLRTALAREELVLYYQPKVDLTTGRVASLEALVRWQHPRRGLVPPGDFIPLAEETGLIVPLGRWALRAACGQAVAWAATHPDIPAPRVAVNLSAREFRDPELVAGVADTLAATALPPERLILEVTESVALEQVEEAIVTMRALRALGVRLALDDFGTGHASLAYLQRLPLDTLKLDRAFFADTPQNRAIVGAVATLAHGLGLDVTAEGLETAAQVAWARAAGCDRGQGFYFARPLPASEIAALWGAGLRFDLPAATAPEQPTPPTGPQESAVSAITRR